MFSCFHVSYNNQGVSIKVSTYHGSATQVNSSFTQFLYLFLVVFELLSLLFVNFLLFIQSVFMLIYCIVNIYLYIRYSILSKNPNIDNLFLRLAPPMHPIMLLTHNMYFLFRDSL